MSSASYSNWVTFDDDHSFQSPKGSLDSDSVNHCVFKPNSLMLNLTSGHNVTRRSASRSGIPPSSPLTSFPRTPNSALHAPAIPSPMWDNCWFKIEDLSQSNQPRGSYSNENGYTNPFWSPRSISQAVHSCCVQQLGQSGNPSVVGAANNLYHGHQPAKETEVRHVNQSNSPLTDVCKKLEKIQSSALRPPLSSFSDSKGPNTAATSLVGKSLLRLGCKDGWPLMMRIPEKKNMMSSRQWGPIYLKLQAGGTLELYYEKGLEKPFRELRLQPYFRLSEARLENYKESGKIHTVKIEHVSYTEKRKYHPKTDVLHEAEAEQVLKLGTTDYKDFIDFVAAIEEGLMKLPPPGQRRSNYEEQEMELEIIDRFRGKFTREGKVLEASVITHIHCLCFVNRGTRCFLALNDLQLQSEERESSDGWIKIHDRVFHKCVKEQEFEKSRIIKFSPPDACRVELMRFKTVCNAPELPFSLRGLVTVHGAYTELQAFLVMSPAFSYPQTVVAPLHCENVMIRFPVPTDWVKIFRTVNLFRQKSLKAKTNRNVRLGSISTMGCEPVMLVTIGTAKYEHAFRAIVWRIDRLPDKNAASDHPHCFSCKLELGSDQEIPSEWQPFVNVEFEVLDTSASRTKVRSMGTESDIQPEKRIHLKAHYHCQVEIEKKWIRIEGEDPDKPGDCATQ